VAEIPELSVSGLLGNRLTGSLGSGEAELDINTVNGSISIEQQSRKEPNQ
jgi:hypothetical protein